MKLGVRFQVNARHTVDVRCSEPDADCLAEWLYNFFTLAVLMSPPIRLHLIVGIHSLSDQPFFGSVRIPAFVCDRLKASLVEDGCRPRTSLVLSGRVA
jgi:hypothetical protein